MAFWSRLSKSKLKFDLFSNEFRRCYTLNHAPIVANQHIGSRALSPVSGNPNFAAQRKHSEFFCNVRLYAAPVLVNQKKEEKDTSGPRLNEQITTPSIRLVTDEGHYVVSRYEALSRARNLKMDLVEVDRNSTPPVCKIYDFHKEKYIQQTKEKERAKSKSTLKKGCKEVRFAAKIKPNDLQIKANMAKKLMESGYRVKCTAIEPTATLDLETLLSRFSALIEDVAIEESGPKVEKKQAFIVVRHAKFGPSKKGTGKKASKAANKNQENGDSLEPYSDTENTDSEELSNEEEAVDRSKKSEWPVFAKDDDINAVFDIENGPTRNSKPEQSAIPPSPMENRYARDPRSTSRVPVQMNGRDSSSIVDGPTRNLKPEQSAIPPSPMENRYARDPRSTSRVPVQMNSHDSRNTVNSSHQNPSHGKQPRFTMNTNTSPPYDVSRENSSLTNDPSAPTKDYGIFSMRQVCTTQNAPVEGNRYKRSEPSDQRMNKRPCENSGQGRYGAFSTESPAEIQRR